MATHYKQETTATICIADIKKIAILKNGIGIEGQKSMQKS